MPLSSRAVGHGPLQRTLRILLVLASSLALLLTGQHAAHASTVYSESIGVGTHLYGVYNDRIQSTDSQGDRVALVMQNDGNLVLYANYAQTGQKAVWASNTPGYGANTYAVFQSDHNFVVYYNSTGTQGTYPIWSSGSSAYSDSTVKVHTYRTVLGPVYTQYATFSAAGKDIFQGCVNHC